MGATTGETHPPIIRALLEKGKRFSFFQVVRLLKDRFPRAPEPGHQGPPSKERIHFRPSLDMAFSSSDVEQVRRWVEPESGEEHFEVTCTFLGAYGQASPLPTYYSEYFLNIEEESKGFVRQFVDLFHHRLISLFYRVWQKYRIEANYRADGTDVYSVALANLLGISEDLLPRRQGVRSWSLLGIAGLLAQQPRSAIILRQMLRDAFPNIDVEVEQCIRQWVSVPADQVNALGEGNCAIGKDLTMGQRVRDRASTFRILLGPISLKDLQSFYPQGRNMVFLRELVDLFNTDCLDYEVVLRVKPWEIPPLEMANPTARVGWSTWLGQTVQPKPVRFLVRGWIHGGR